MPWDQDELDGFKSQIPKQDTLDSDEEAGKKDAKLPWQ